MTHIVYAVSSGDWRHSQGSDDDSEQDSDSEEDYRPTRSTRAASR